MAKRRRMGKQAYRMTSRRKVALRKAQLASARKRKGMNKALKSVGVAGALGVAALGYKISKSSSIQADIKGRDFRFTNSRNALAGRISPQWKEANVINNAVSPASAARQAPPVTEAKASNSTPKPNSSTKKPNVETFNGWKELAGTSETVVPSQGAVVDPTPPPRKAFPAELMPTEREILHRLGKTDRSTVTRDDAKLISKLWVEEKLKGKKIPGITSKSVGNVGLYMGVLDIFGLETEKAEKARLAGKA